MVDADASLQTPDAKLGSLGLKRDALGQGSYSAALSHVLTDSVQSEIDDICEAESNSMDVERKHQLDKQSERTKLMSMALASRNQ